MSQSAQDAETSSCWLLLLATRKHLTFKTQLSVLVPTECCRSRGGENTRRAGAKSHAGTRKKPGEASISRRRLNLQLLFTTEDLVSPLSPLL